MRAEVGAGRLFDYPEIRYNHYMDRFAVLSAEDQRQIREIAAATNRRNRGIRERFAAEIAARREEAWAEVYRLLQLFRAIDSSIDSVVLFGSLARDDMKRPDFDIDIAVRSERFLELIGAVEDCRFKVDLVDMRCASGYIADAIRREGIEVRDGEQV